MRRRLVGLANREGALRRATMGRGLSEHDRRTPLGDFPVAEIIVAEITVAEM